MVFYQTILLVVIAYRWPIDVHGDSAVGRECMDTCCHAYFLRNETRGLRWNHDKGASKPTKLKGFLIILSLFRLSLDNLAGHSSELMACKVTWSTELLNGTGELEVGINAKPIPWLLSRTLLKRFCLFLNCEKKNLVFSSLVWYFTSYVSNRWKCWKKPSEGIRQTRSSNQLARLHEQGKNTKTPLEFEINQEH